MKTIPEILKIISRDTSPPLYNLTEHLAFQSFGTSEIVIRSLSFFYYSLAILFVYKIASFLWDRKTGLIAAALSFFNPFFFIYAFEGRMYSIMALGVAASMYFFLRIIYTKLPQRGKTKVPLFHIIGYILATDWALYSHHFAIFAVFIQGLWFLWLLITGKRKMVKWLLVSFVAIGLIYSPWLLPLYNQTKMVSGGFWLGTPTKSDLRNLIYEYLAQGIKNPLSNYALYLVFIILLLRKWHQAFQRSLFSTLWFLGPILLAWLISQKFQSIFYNRYLLYTIPAVTLILSSNRRLLSNIFIALLLIIFIKIDYTYFTHPTKRPFREFAQYVKEVKRGDDYLLNWNAASHHIWETKYYGIPAPLYIPEKANLPFFVGTALMQESDIVHTLPKKAFRIGVITSGSIDDVAIPNYTKGETKIFGDLKFIWYTK